MLWEYMLGYGQSWFVTSGLSVAAIFAAIGLAIALGALWLCAFWPPLFKKHWLWAVAVVSAFLTLAGIIFIQVPLQYWLNLGWTAAFDQATILNWVLLIGIPSLLVSGLVQEAGKMAPILFWRYRSGKSITPQLGLAIGAVAGAGFGVLEAFHVFSSLFQSGWTVSNLGDGFIGIAGFWERFFIIAFHTSISALVGYGVAKGKWWKYYLVAAGLHALVNYGSIILQHWYFTTGYIALVQVEVYVAVLAIITTAIVLLSRWGKRGLLPIATDVTPGDEWMEPAELAAGEPEAEDRATMPADADAVIDAPADNPEDGTGGDDQGNP